MKIINEEISLSTEGNCDIIDITGKVNSVLKKSGIKEGLCTLFSSGSTGGITTIEYEPGLLNDLPELLNRIIPPGRYHHDDTWGDGNGHSHLRSALLKTSLTVPVVKGELTLGTWQQIVFLDFDNRKRNRKITVNIMGE
ncbi:MAG: YjbQ family protein [Ignavibacteria bacterium]|nr:YjbQ family protein [Ignavibacteria bacterium]